MRGAGAIIALSCALAGCGGARVERLSCLPGSHARASSHRGACSAELPVHALPLPAGVVTRVNQGFHGHATHEGSEAYAIDLACADGDPIVASRAGLVRMVREDSLVGCADASCVREANYVVLDHGDGTFSEYHHLAPMGATVRPGQTVCAGQLVGLCGSTGFAGGAHLHWSVTDLSGISIPFALGEGRERFGLGLPLPEQSYRSQNERVDGCRAISASLIERGAFLHQGVELRRALPSVFELGQGPIRVEGYAWGEASHVALHRSESGAGAAWQSECAPIGSDGRFELTFDWSGFRAGPHVLMITQADKSCRNPGWAWSYRVDLVPAAQRE